MKGNLEGTSFYYYFGVYRSVVFGFVNAIDRDSLTDDSSAPQNPVVPEPLVGNGHYASDCTSSQHIVDCAMRHPASPRMFESPIVGGGSSCCNCELRWPRTIVPIQISPCLGRLSDETRECLTVFSLQVPS
jgi:hypothetical protein